MNKKYIANPCDLLHFEGVKSTAVILLFLFLSMMISACSSDTTVIATNGNNSVTATSHSSSVTKTATVAQVATATQGTTTYPVKVYFSRVPLSNTNFDAVFPVDRLAPTSSTGTFAIEQLIAGPNTSESTLGYFSEVKNHLVGSSSCQSGATKAGFTLTLNTKGTTSEPGTATLKFCQQFVSSGIGTDARAIAEIQTTLKQFSSIKKVVILTQDSHCFGDESGADMCLH